MTEFYNFLSENSIYIVLLIVLSIWIGIFIFTNNIDKKLKSFDKLLNEDYADE